MNKNVKIVSVFVEKDSITCECVCALHDVNVGDYVQIFLNNAPTVGEVKTCKEVAITELPNSVYDMKQVIRKMPNPNKSTAALQNTIRVSDLINRNRRITLIGRGAVGDFLFSNADVEAHKAEVGDIIYFTDDEGDPLKAVILKISDSSEVVTPRLQISAIQKNEKTKEFTKNQLRVECGEDTEEEKVTLLTFKLREEEYVLDDVVTHIGTKAFERSRKLKKLVIATIGVTIEPMAFSYNDSLEEISILDENAKIAVNCFDGCRKLKNVVLPFNLYHMRFELAEYYGEKINFIYILGAHQHLLDGIVYTKDWKEVICCIDEDIEEYRAPLTVEYIRPYAFKNCKKLRLFVGSPFMKQAGFAIFDGCMALRKVYSYFEKNIDVLVHFGQTPCDDAETEEVKYEDGSKRVFYLPQNCKYIKVQSPAEVLKDLKPNELDPNLCHFIANYYSSIHKTKEAVQFHAAAAKQGYDKSYQKLAEYVQNESLREYFTIDLYDYADRLLTVKPFFRMLQNEYPEYTYTNEPDEEILEQFMDTEQLRELLRKISQCRIFDTDLLNFGLNKIFCYTEDVHDLEIKRLFLRCVQKIGRFDNILDWREELLEDVLVSEADYREFAFMLFDMTSIRATQEKEDFIASMPECETKETLDTAYVASQQLSPDCVDVFESFLLKAKETGDTFYQKCALIAIHPYLSYCWREKREIAQFRKMLDLVVKRYEEGFHILGYLILTYKQNMKRSVPKRFYMECAERLYEEGLLWSSAFDNLLGKHVQEDTAFFCKYPEYYRLDDKETFVMKKLTKQHFYIPGTMIKKPENSQSEPRIYTNYTPELIDGKLLLFLNPHEGASYLMKNGAPLPDEFFPVNIGEVLSMLSLFELEEATLLPRFLNRSITKAYIESIYDWR